MAQYIFVSASAFGNGHSDNPTYSFSVGTGTIFMSGSGGYVLNPVNITKSTLDNPGVKLELSDENISYVTCSVDAGFTCEGTISYVSWVPAPTPTPTATPATSYVLIELLAAAQETGTWPEYTVQINMVGYKNVTRIVQQTSPVQLNDNFEMILTGTPDGTGTITISRTAPDATPVDSCAITIGQSDGFTTSPTFRSYLTGQSITNASFSVSGFDHGEDMTINISEG